MSHRAPTVRHPVSPDASCPILGLPCAGLMRAAMPSTQNFLVDVFSRCGVHARIFMIGTSMGKLPIITALFWVMKILATTLGETGGDVAGQTLNLGYLASAFIFIAVLAAVLVAQLRTKRFHSALFWSVIVATSLVGTEISDFMNRTVGLGYAGGALVLITCLAIVLVAWRLSGHTMNVEHIDSRRGELFYWLATLISNTLGTSTGDYLAHDTGLGLGYVASTITITACLAMIAFAHYFTPISGTLLFWAAYVLTRPLGANAGNVMSKTHQEGGLGLGTFGASGVLLGLLLICIAYQMSTHRQQTRHLVHADSSAPRADDLEHSQLATDALDNDRTTVGNDLRTPDRRDADRRDADRRSSD